MILKIMQKGGRGAVEVIFSGEASDPTIAPTTTQPRPKLYFQAEIHKLCPGGPHKRKDHTKSSQSRYGSSQKQIQGMALDFVLQTVKQASQNGKKV
jgi:hypothetical protein